jgi:hypothetical protein
LEAAFKLLDIDDVGELDRDALEAFFETSDFEEGGPLANIMAACDLGNFMMQADKDSDLKISLEEFKNALKTQSFKPFEEPTFEIPFALKAIFWGTCGLVAVTAGYSFYSLFGGKGKKRQMISYSLTLYII